MENPKDRVEEGRLEEDYKTELIISSLLEDFEEVINDWVADNVPWGLHDEFKQRIKEEL